MQAFLKRALSALVLAVIFIPLSMAQEPTKQREVGLTFSSLNSFGFTYRFGHERSLWRFNSLLADFANRVTENDDFKQTLSNVNASVRFGKEYRADLTERFEFRYGADVSFGFQYNNTETENKSDNNLNQSRETIRYIPGINAVLGFNYAINEHFLVGAEFLPGVRYAVGTTEESSMSGTPRVESDISEFDVSLNTSSALLSVVYRF